MMSEAASHALAPEKFRMWGQALLVAGLVAGITLILLLAWLAPEFLPLMPAALLAGVALAYVVRAPLLHLCLVLFGFFLIAEYEEGIQLGEIVYGIYYLSYLGCWFVSRWFFFQERLLKHRADWALFLFILYATAGFGFTLLFQGDLLLAFNYWLPVTLLAFYFPVKEACIRDRRAPGAILLTLGALVLLIALRNFWSYYELLTSASEVWQVMIGRVRMNERLLMLGSFGALVFFLYARSLAGRAAAGIGFVLAFGGIVIGQSRGVWVAFLLGAAVVFLLTDRRRKIHLALFSAGGAGLLALAGAMLFDEMFSLIVYGLSDRFFTLQDAAVNDVSLVNRFYEWEAALGAILHNPVLGYGFAVPFQFFDITYNSTIVKSHIHNTYLMIWYQHGLIGLLLVLWFYATAVWKGVCLFWLRRAPLLHRLTGLVASVYLIAIAVSATMESLFQAHDGTFVIAVPAALAMGLSARYAAPPRALPNGEPAPPRA